MMPKPANPYLKTKIMTATAEELRLMLYDGAIRFSKQAREALEAKDNEAAFNGLMRAQKIVLELSTSLNHQADPKLCAKLSALYTYIYRKLVDANMKHDTASVDEAIRLLDYERETWQMLMKKNADQPGNASHTSPGGANAQQTAMSSLTISG